MTKKLIFIALLLTGMLATVQAQPGSRHMKDADTNGDGQISAEEFTAASQKHFAKMDANGDGVLSEDEMGRRGRGKARGKRSAEGRRHRIEGHGRGHGQFLIRLADTDKDRAVSADEWGDLLGQVTSDDGETIDFEKLQALLPEGRTIRHSEDAPTVTVGQAQSLFDRLDANSDGAITSDEQPRRRGKRRVQRELGGMMLLHGADTDGEPGLSADEWAAFVSAVDADGDGSFTPQQLADVIHANLAVKGPESRSSRMGAHLDSDDDGTPDVAGLQAAFQKLDANGDGAITEDELPKRRQRMRQRH